MCNTLKTSFCILALKESITKGVQANYHRLTDVRTLLLLAALLPLQQSVKNLVVFAQSPTMNVCEFHTITKVVF
jgi:hypothetical protein